LVKLEAIKAVKQSLKSLRVSQVVLGGDPKQLGPVIHSPEAQKHGLKTSLLERLLGRPMYADYDPKYITMLKRNYRSHALLLEVPNALFYDGALEACADPMITIAVSIGTVYPHKECPFVGTVLKERRIVRLGHLVGLTLMRLSLFSNV